MLSKLINDNLKELCIEDMTKQEAIKFLKGRGVKFAWVQRQSDVSSYVLDQLAKAGGYHFDTVEPFRKTNGNVRIQFKDNYWVLNTTTTYQYQKSELYEKLQADLNEFRKGDPFYNTSLNSSEKRHCIFLARAIAITYKLAFNDTIDVERVKTEDIIIRERRKEVYKIKNNQINRDIAQINTVLQKVADVSIKPPKRQTVFSHILNSYRAL